MDTWRTDWMKSKRDVALRLASRECGGSYGEAVIILCAAISALAADVWPGRGKDRARFVEVLIEFARSDLNTTRISIPLLMGFLRREARASEMLRLKEAFLDYSPSRVLTGDEVDKFENEIIGVCPTPNPKEIREYSYGNLLYEEIRSGYAHEYRPGSRADSLPMTSVRTTPVSYVNWVNDPDRHVHFHVEWIADVAVALAQAVDAASATLPRTDQPKWWVHGYDK